MIDLHTHSYYSDGSESPERVVSMAATAGCSAIALTDHDELAGIPRARAEAQRLGIEFIGGCEVSCSWQGTSCHMLVYFIDPGTGPLQDELGHLRVERSRRNQLMIAKLQQAGIDITDKEVDACSGLGQAGRPHIARLLMEKGLASSIDEAFERWLGPTASTYVPHGRLGVADLLGLVKQSGAVASLAHPLRLGMSESHLDVAIAQMAKLGLAGLEANYGDYEPIERARLAATAKRHDLVATGGSDFHGSYKPALQVGSGRGSLNVADLALEELRARR